MKAAITFVDGSEITVDCEGFNTWHNDEIKLAIDLNPTPRVCYIYPYALVRRCEIRRDDGSLAYLNEEVNDKYINGEIDENGQFVEYSQSLWDVNKIPEYLAKGEHWLGLK
jgi:hypothetical protein